MRPSGKPARAWFCLRHCEKRGFRSNSDLQLFYRLRIASWPSPTRLGRHSLGSGRHRLAEVVRNLVEEARRRKPALIGADEQREILGHVAVLDGVDTDFLQRVREFSELFVVVELGAVGEAPGPGEDRGDRVGRGLLALLVLAIVAGDGPVGGAGVAPWASAGARGAG